MVQYSKKYVKRSVLNYSTNPETEESAEKIVFETYVWETTELIYLMTNGESIKTTYKT